jgi:deoxyribose-phosphate aldolase
MTKADTLLARRALALLDLTDLSDHASETTTLHLAAKALASPVPVAALCVWPQFANLARRQLRDAPVRIATVVNFPAGGTNLNRIAADITEALDDGADEIDMVLPWKAFLEGAEDIARDFVAEARALTQGRTLKVILESGMFPDQATLRRAADLCLDGGADFLKTSTGKAAISATPEAATTMLEAIHASGKPAGFKASGGIRTLEDAGRYLDLADRIMGPDWATPATFRFGASSLMDALLAALKGGTQPERGDGVY